MPDASVRAMAAAAHRPWLLDRRRRELSSDLWARVLAFVKASEYTMDAYGELGCIECWSSQSQRHEADCAWVALVLELEHA